MEELPKKSTQNLISFIAKLCPIQSAITFSPNGKARIKLEVEAEYGEEVFKLQELNRFLVSIEPLEE